MGEEFISYSKSKRLKRDAWPKRFEWDEKQTKQVSFQDLTGRSRDLKEGEIFSKASKICQTLREML